MNTFLPARSLAYNKIGAIAMGLGEGSVSTTEGITALCEGLKGSALTALT